VLFLAFLALPSWGQTPPDAIRLKSGALYRGTISELVPDGQVVMVIVTGETKTFAMSDVEYAGPAASLPGSAPAAAPLPEAPIDARVEVHFHADVPEITLHRRTGSSQMVGMGMGFGSRGGAMFSPFAARAESYETLCKSPCTLKLDPGTYYFALSSEDGDPVSDRRAVAITRGGGLVGQYEDNSSLRTGGWVLIGASLVAALGVSIVSIPYADISCVQAPCPGSNRSLTPLLVGGIAAGLGTLAGLILVFQTDEATVALE